MWTIAVIIFIKYNRLISLNLQGIALDWIFKALNDIYCLMMKIPPSNMYIPKDTERLLLCIRRFCEPGTCAVLQFSQLIKELGDCDTIENAIRIYRGTFIRY